MHTLVPFLYGDKWGFSTRYPDAKIVIDCIYDEVLLFQNLRAAVKIGEKWGLIDEFGNWVLNPIYEDFGPIQEERIPFKYDGYWGLMDLDCRVIINPDCYESMARFFEGKSIVSKEGKFGYIEKDGGRLTKLEFDDANFFKDGLATVKKDGKYGCIDHNGKLCIDFISEIPINFSEGVAAVAILSNNQGIDKAIDPQIAFSQKMRYDYTSGALFGYIDTEGKYLIEPLYEEAHDFKQGLALTRKNGRFGFININNEIIIPHIYLEAGKFHEGLARVMSDEYRTGFIDQFGKVVIPIVFEEAFDFNEGLAKVVCEKEILSSFEEDVSVLVNVLSKKVVKRGEDIYFNEYLNEDEPKKVFFTKEGKYIDFLRYIDFDGNNSGEYDYWQDEFSEGKIAVGLPWGKKFFIDRYGNVISKPLFDDCGPFQNDLAQVSFGTDSNIDSLKYLYGFIDSTGFIYRQNKTDKNKLFVKVGHNKWSLKNLDIQSFSNGKTITHIRSLNDLRNLEKSNQKSACCSSGFDSSYDADYGLLYNWYAVNDLSGIAPEGWRMPSEHDFVMLEHEYGCRNSSKLYDMKLPNDDGQSISGFDVKFAGGFSEDEFSGLEDYTIFWSSTEYDQNSAIGLFIEKKLFLKGEWSLDYMKTIVLPKSSFYSIRLIK